MVLPVLAVLIAPVLAVVSGVFEIVPAVVAVLLEIIAALLAVFVAADSMDSLRLSTRWFQLSLRFCERSLQFGAFLRTLRGPTSPKLPRSPMLPRSADVAPRPPWPFLRERPPELAGRPAAAPAPTPRKLPTSLRPRTICSRHDPHPDDQRLGAQLRDDLKRCRRAVKAVGTGGSHFLPAHAGRQLRGAVS